MYFRYKETDIPRGKVSCPHSAEKVAAGLKSRPVWSTAQVLATRSQGLKISPKQVRGKIFRRPIISSTVPDDHPSKEKEDRSGRTRSESQFQLLDFRVVSTVLENYIQESR